MNRKTNFKVRNNEWANQDILGTENGHREKEVTVDIINTLVVDFFFIFNISFLKCSCKSVSECQEECRNMFLHWGN